LPVETNASTGFCVFCAKNGVLFLRLACYSMIYIKGGLHGFFLTLTLTNK